MKTKRLYSVCHASTLAGWIALQTLDGRGHPMPMVDWKNVLTIIHEAAAGTGSPPHEIVALGFDLPVESCEESEREGVWLYSGLLDIRKCVEFNLCDESEMKGVLNVASKD